MGLFQRIESKFQRKVLRKEPIEMLDDRFMTPVSPIIRAPPPKNSQVRNVRASQIQPQPQPPSQAPTQQLPEASPQSPSLPSAPTPSNTFHGQQQFDFGFDRMGLPETLTQERNQENQVDYANATAAGTATSVMGEGKSKEHDGVGVGDGAEIPPHQPGLGSGDLTGDDGPRDSLNGDRRLFNQNARNMTERMRAGAGRTEKYSVPGDSYDYAYAAGKDSEYGDKRMSSAFSQQQAVQRARRSYARFHKRGGDENGGWEEEREGDGGGEEERDWTPGIGVDGFPTDGRHDGSRYPVFGHEGERPGGSG